MHRIDNLNHHEAVEVVVVVVVVLVLILPLVSLISEQGARSLYITRPPLRSTA